MFKKIRNLDVPTKLKLFVSYILIFSIPVILIGIASYHWISAFSETKTRDAYESTLEKVKRTVDQEFEGVVEFTAKLSQMRWVRKVVYSNNDYKSSPVEDLLAIQEGSKELTLYTYPSSFINTMAIYFNNNDIIVSSEGSLHTCESFFQGMFKVKTMDIFAWRSIINQYNNMLILPDIKVNIYNKISEGYVYIKTLPIFEKPGVNATLIAFIDKKYIESILNNIHLNITGFIMMDKDGNPIVGRGIDKVDLEKIREITVLDNNRELSSEISVNNKSSVIFTNVSEKTGLKYMIVATTQSVMERVYKVQIIINILLLMSMFIGLALSYELTKMNYKPINKLVEMVKGKMLRYKFNQGEFNIKRNKYIWLESVIYTMLEQNAPLLKNKYLLDLLNGISKIDDELLNKLRLLDISFIHPFYCSAIIITGSPGKLKNLYELISFQSREYGVQIYFAEEMGREIIIFNYIDKVKLYKYIKYIEILLEEKTNTSFTISVGNEYDNIHQISVSYKEAFIALHNTIVENRKKVILYEEVMDKSCIYYYPIDQEYSIVNSLKTGDYDNVVILFNALVEKNVAYSKRSSYSIEHFFLNTIMTAVKVINDIGADDIIKIDPNEIFMHDTVDKKRIYIEKIYFDICFIVKKKKQEQDSLLKEAIIDYINTNYLNPLLSLSSVANNFKMSQSHLSNYCKEQYGWNFLEYVNRKRIKYATELIKSDNTRYLNTIAKDVGYFDDGTFRRLFKKYEGISPSKYRDNLKDIE